MRTDRAFAFYALGRAAYGASPDTVRSVVETGFPAWVEEQLQLHAPADPPLAERLRAARLRIKYPAGEGWAALDEARPLTSLDAPISTLWRILEHRQAAHPLERRRPRDEIVAATVLRAVHARAQVREVMTAFWHDHFNVDANNEPVGIALPVYDRDTIRMHCIGNFRELLESVARSTAMQYYLSNRSSRAGAANENFARELFELHTLGRGAYMNDRYDRWRDVPGATRGKPSGYIDQDVYEAARAFTGWTIEEGSTVDGRRKLPQSGQFTYVENWHDGYQKRVLATEFDAFAPALADGRRVLDLLAAHPATARFVCDKLCRRFLGDPVPVALRTRLEQVWLERVEARDQIAATLRALLLSNDFSDARTQARKVRRPLQLAAGVARALGIDLSYAEPLGREIGAAGQNLFAWPTPTGLPDNAPQFLNSQALRHRWSLVLGLAENTWGTGTLPAPAGEMPTTRTAVVHVLEALLGDAPPAAVQAIVEGSGWPADQRLNAAGDKDAVHRWSRLAAFCAMAPQFQVT